MSPITNLPSHRLVSLSQPCPALSAAAFLRHARGRERFYWRDGSNQATLAGFGIATELMAWGKGRFGAIEQQARELFEHAVLLDSSQPLAAPRLFGGFAFRDDFMPDNTWSVFHPAHFILPHYQLAVLASGEAWLTINTLLPIDEEPVMLLPQLQEALDMLYELLLAQVPSPHPPAPSASLHQGRPNTRRGGAGSPHPRAPSASLLQGRPSGRGGVKNNFFPAVQDVNYPMSREKWAEIINHAVGEMQTGELNKVVLSRVCEIRLSRPVDVEGALAYLNQHYADCYRFLFEPRPFHAFYGATPELLANIEGKRLRTMALAGSIGRGKTEAEDKALAQHLLTDPKERYEHELVATVLRERLTPLTTSLEVPVAPSIYKLSNIQHLYTPFEGDLRETRGILPILSALHPTPALGGSPRDLAMGVIRESEPIPRGWYAAPIGWIDVHLDGTFGVAIRSAVSQHRRVWLYAGAGIVSKSVPAKEWDETGLKFRPMLNALGLGLGVREEYS